MAFRWLPPEEWGKLEEVFQDLGRRYDPRPVDESGKPADSGPCLALVEEDEHGRLIGVQFFLVAYHMEPMWIRPEFRGNGHGSALMMEMVNSIPPGQEVYCFSQNYAGERMLEKAKVEMLDWKVWKTVGKAVTH